MTDSEGREIAVIGATGFVGRHAVAHLQARGHRIRAVSRSGGRRPEWGAAVDAMAGDVVTGDGIETALRGADAVVHLVAIPREGGGRRFDEVNVRGVGRVLVIAWSSSVPWQRSPCILGRACPRGRAGAGA